MQIEKCACHVTRCLMKCWPMCECEAERRSHCEWLSYLVKMRRMGLVILEMNLASTSTCCSPSNTCFACRVLIRLAHSLALIYVGVVSCLPADADSAASSAPRPATATERIGEETCSKVCFMMCFRALMGLP